MREVVLFFFGAAALASEAIAQRGDDVVAKLDQLARCRSITAPNARLDCFDQAAASISAARASGELLAFDRRKVIAERQVRFGLVDVPDGAGAEAAAKAARVREISSTIAGVEAGPGFGRWNLKLGNGQVWQILGSDRYGPRAGASIRLLTTVTGGFRASIDRAEPVNVKRLR